MQGNRDITGSQLDNLKASAFPHVFLTYKSMGMSVKLGATEKVANRDAYLLTFQPPTGNPLRQYVDAETFLPTRSIIRAELPQMGEIEQWIDPSDVRELDGVKVPFKLTLTNSMQTIAFTFSKIEHNVAVDDKMFVKP